MLETPPAILAARAACNADPPAHSHIAVPVAVAPAVAVAVAPAVAVAVAPAVAAECHVRPRPGLASLRAGGVAARCARYRPVSDVDLGSLDLAELAGVAAGCTLCPLSDGRLNVVFGTGDPNADLMFVGEGPGAEEDKQGLPFVGRSGKLLDELLAQEIGLQRSAVYIANVVKCRPPENRDPQPEEIAACRPYLQRQVELVAPRVLVTLGNFAMKVMLDTTEGITRVRGRRYAWADGVVLVPTYHPAALLRGGGERIAEARADFVRARLSLMEARPS